MNLNAWQRAVLLVFAAAITVIQVAALEDSTNGWVVGFATAAALALLGLSRRRVVERQPRHQFDFNVWQRVVLLAFAVGVAFVQVNIINYDGINGPGWVVGFTVAAALGALGLSPRRVVDPGTTSQHKADGPSRPRRIGRRTWIIGAASLVILSTIGFFVVREMRRRAYSAYLDSEFGPAIQDGSLADLAATPPGFVPDPSWAAVEPRAGSFSTQGATARPQATRDSSSEVVVPGIARLHLPATLEVQNAAYRRLANPMAATADDASTSGTRFVVQPRGINGLDPAALKQYCRIIVETKPLTPSLRTFMSALPLTSNEVRELNEILKKEVGETLGEKMKLLRWYGTGHAQVGNASGISTSYLRQLGDNAPVSVIVYMVPRGSSLVSVTISFREAEAGLWEHQLQQVRRTMTFLDS